VIPLPTLITAEELLVRYRTGVRWTQRIPAAGPDHVVIDFRDSHESRLIALPDLERMRTAQRASRASRI
jgi:hypothetical protein